LRHKLPLFYFGDLADEDHDHFHSLIPPIQQVHKPTDINNNYPLFDETSLCIKDLNEHKHIIQKYRQLCYKLRFLGKYFDIFYLKNSFFCIGLFDCNYVEYGRECSRYILLACFSLYFFLGATTSWHYYVSAVFLGAFWHQLTFTAHDAGHLAITHSYRIDSFIGIFIANILGGVSLGWWKRHHNIHHLVTNSPEHDPGQYLIKKTSKEVFSMMLPPHCRLKQPRSKIYECRGSISIKV